MTDTEILKLIQDHGVWLTMDDGNTYCIRGEEGVTTNREALEGHLELFLEEKYKDRIPNEETIAAMNEDDASLDSFDSVEEFFKHVDEEIEFVDDPEEQKEENENNSDTTDKLISFGWLWFNTSCICRYSSRFS